MASWVSTEVTKVLTMLLYRSHSMIYLAVYMVFVCGIHNTTHVEYSVLPVHWMHSNNIYHKMISLHRSVYGQGS